ILLFADDIEVMGPDRAGRRAIVLTYLFLVAFGNPFKWEKQREGLKVDWIGLHTDYTVYKLGISEERCAWLVGWRTEVEVSCSVWPRVMAAGLGRLCYTANALFWERPFLGPIYAWVSSVGGLDRKEPPSITGEATELFRSDAKAEGGKAWIGAWETRFSLDPKGWAPWAFSMKDPNRVIAALELLGNLAAGKVHCISDNLGNTYIVVKGMTTKYPIALILMELSVKVDPLNLKWLELPELMKSSELLYKQIVERSSAIGAARDGKSRFSRELEVNGFQGDPLGTGTHGGGPATRPLRLLALREESVGDAPTETLGTGTPGGGPATRPLRLLALVEESVGEVPIGRPG
ncbi:unnamed protein product, partial [Polarella glacialis]